MTRYDTRDDPAVCGYPNYATFACVLWLTNDRAAIYQRARAIAAQKPPAPVQPALMEYIAGQCARGWGLRTDLLEHATRMEWSYHDVLRSVDWPRVVAALRSR